MSKIACVPMNETDRKKALEWLSAIRKDTFPDEFIPHTGIACYINNNLACVIPIYFEGSTNVAVFGFCLIEQNLARREKYIAAETAMRYGLTYAFNNGKRHILTLFGLRSINRIADRIGLTTADRNVEEKMCTLV